MSDWNILKEHLTPERCAKMEKAASRRVKHIRLVVQDVHHPHNVSACMRSAEGLGILNVDVVNLSEPFKASTVSRGVTGWLQVEKYPTVAACAEALRSQGYAIAAALPDRNAVSLGALPVEKPVALLFGNEHEGVSEEWLPYLDYRFTIPMTGMAQSFNISVSAAISMYDVLRRVQEMDPNGERCFLNEAEKLDLLSSWAHRQLDSADEILKRARQ
ncbi:MAG: TrmH family RNA methyltransferase [Oligoflexales bacterium]